MTQVRLMNKDDIESVANYWATRNDKELVRMGADPALIPDKTQWMTFLDEEYHKANKSKKYLYTIWLKHNSPIGHCNVNMIDYGSYAYMHLHIWNQENRKQGLGNDRIKHSIDLFFRELDLKILYCQPKANNTAPNKTLKKLGFSLIKKYITKPGPINFEQEVCLWQMTRAKWNTLRHGH